MKFEKFVNGQWVIIDYETLLREVKKDDVDMMITYPKLTIKVGLTTEYRRHIPSVVRDWAVINRQTLDPNRKIYNSPRRQT